MGARLRTRLSCLRTRPLWPRTPGGSAWGKPFRVRRVAAAGKERESRSRPYKMNAHEQRHGHAEKNAEQRKPQIVEADGLVARAEDVAGQEAGLWHLRVICSAIVVGHACLGSLQWPEAEPGPRARDK